MQQELEGNNVSIILFKSKYAVAFYILIYTIRSLQSTILVQ